MNRVAYILGTNHIYQRADESCEPRAVDAFREYMDRVCQAHRIKAIGEEMSISVLRDFNRTESIPEKFATTHGKCHKYCDPDSAEQQRLGIRGDQCVRYHVRDHNLSQEQIKQLLLVEDSKRERYWLCKVKELNVWPLLFICGSDHVRSFAQLLSTVATAVHVAHENWSPNSRMQADARKSSARG
jgi:hypothetical protein